jgi:hypothetical protein
MTSEDRAWLWALVSAHHRGDFDGALQMISILTDDEKTSLLVSLVSVVCSVCAVTLWANTSDEEVTALLQRMATR